MDDFPTTNDFLKLFYHAVPYGWLELTLLKADCYPRVYWMELPNSLNDAQLAYLEEQNEHGWNVYFGVTVRSVKQDKGRGKRGDALFTRVLWADMDEKTPEAYQRLRAANPSLIIDSGGGYHGYWLLNAVLTLNGNPVPADTPRGVFAAADDDLLKRTLKGLAVCLQADVKVAEYARIMRLPGFANMKPERGGALCHVVEDKLYTYDFMDLALAYAPYVKSELKVERKFTPPTDDTLPLTVQRYLQSGAAQGERNSTLNKMAYILHSIGKSHSEIVNLLAARASADGLPDHEIQQTIDSACSAQAAPIMTTRSRRVAARDRKLSK